MLTVCIIPHYMAIGLLVVSAPRSPHAGTTSTIAAAPTTGVVRAAGDEVSALTAMQFAGHAEIYQAMSAQAAAIHQRFVDVLAVSADSYAATEAANTVAAR